MVLFCLLLLVPAASLLASTESYIQTLSGKIKKGDSCVVYDDKFLNMPLAEWNQVRHLSVNNLITFELRRDTAFYYQARPFSCTLNITIKYFTSRDQASPDEIKNVDLVVKYDTGAGKFYPLSDSYTKLKNAFKVTVVVNSITSQEWGKDLPPIFRISNQILIERKYPFNRDESPRFIMGSAGGPAFDYNNAGIPVLAVRAGPNEAFNTWVWSADAFAIGMPVPNSYNQFPISWAPVSGLDEYDIEWTFIDLMSNRGQQIYTNAAWYNQAQDKLLSIPDVTETAWMRNNNTRVSVKGMYTYYIDLPYQEGFILCRVRGVSYNGSTGLRQTTPWTYTYTDAGNNTYTYGAHIIAHQPALNWQYTASFAEEGKRKEVISYFDGSLRSRQAVTITNNSTDHSSARNNAVVAENIYDKMGRATMNVLPAPVTDIQLKYYLSINKNMAGTTYSRDDIVLLTTKGDKSCNISAWPMSTQSGASQYYSPNNPFLPNTTDFFYAKYIPDAGGFPFFITEYTPDNTGRIRRQGGVGPTFQVGNGHDTKYYYGKPNGPKDLERLFGMEVGDVSHYEKNMVIDANGQASVSYIDANGKTIATALAGLVPPNLDALPSSATTQAKTTFNQVLIQPTDFTIDAGGLYKSSSSTFMAAYPGSYTLHYSVNPATAVPTSPMSGGSFCSNCYYDISISVADNCGNPVLPAFAITPPFPGSDINCYSNRPAYTGDVGVPIQTIGEYTVTYILKLSEKEINFQTDYYVTNNSSLYTIQHFFEEELLKVDLSGCYNECSTCIAKLGSPLDFAAKMQKLLTDQKAEKYPNLPENYLNLNSTFIQSWITNTYNNLVANCQSMQANCSQGSPCEQKKQMMKYDVMPGGQYGLYDESALQTNAAQVFLDRTINVPLLNYKSMPEYFTADDGSQVHAVDDNGTLARNLSEADFIRAFQAHLEWADYFVQFHIEYCSYQYCKISNVEPGYVFDQNLRQLYTTGEIAVAKGYYNHSNIFALLNNDPFFNGSGGGTSYRSQMSSDLQAYTDALNIKMKDASGNALSGKDIISYIDWALYCEPPAGSTAQQWASSWQSCSVNAACRSVGREWQLYRDFYLQLKSKYVRLAKLTANPNCTDCFIGKDALVQNSCLLPTASDYQVIIGANGRSPIVYVAYKNETAPFVENYVIQYQATKNGITTSGTITATQGVMRAYFSFTAPDDVPPTFTITSISCPSSTGSGLINCSGGNAGPCPTAGDFNYEYNNYLDANYPSYFYHDYDIWYVHSSGPVSRKVNIQVKQTIENFYSGTYEDYFWTTIEAGQDSVSIGTYDYSWSDSNGDGNVSEEEITTINYTVVSGSITCPQEVVIPSTCIADPRYPFYISKNRIFNEYIDQTCLNQMGTPYAADGNGYSAASLPALRDAANTQVDAMKAGWLSRLQAVRDQEFPTYAATLSDAFLATLVDKLANVSKAYIATATENNMRPVSTLPAGQNSADGFNSFEAVFNSLVGSTLMHLGFSHHLLDKPYPYDKPNFDADPPLSEITSGVCSNLTNFYNRWVSLGSPQTFPKWMAQELGDDYNLTDLQLTDLQNKCAASCTHRYLNEGAIMPVALALSSNTDHPSLNCTRVTALQNSFASLYPTVTQADKPELYHLLFTNFVNLSTGYSLAYDEYNTFITNVCPVTATALLYDKPASPQAKPDDFLCSAGIMKSVFTTAGIEYRRYIEIVRRQFRNSYVSNCLAAQANANMTSEQWEYHFTLYYYDQSGNLVKTIPPEGVRLLSDEEIDRVEQFKNDNQSCPAFPATVLIDKNAILSQLSITLQNNTALSTEMWLFSNAGGTTRQLRMITPDNKYMYQAAISDNKLWVELYTLTPASGAYTITLTNHAAANLVSTIPLQNWTHLVVESTGGVGGGSLQLYLDGYKLTNIPAASIPPYPFLWTIVGGSPLPAEDVAVVKHLRVYNQTLSDPQVLSHYRNSCQGILPELAGTPLLLWGRFNTPPFCNYVAGGTQVVSTPNKGSLTITTNPNEGSNNISSVINTFTVEFWVNPATTEPYNANQLTNIYDGVDGGHHYAIFPTWGGDENSGKASMGVSVGTDGIAVFEHAGSYMPCLLAWRGTMTGWHHVAVVYTNKTPALYVDGVYKTTGRLSTKTYISPSYNFGGGGYGFMQGGLDEVRIWNTARTGTEILTNYNKAITPDNQPGLVGYWPMDGSAGAIIKDITCNNLNVALNTSVESIVATGANVPQYDYVEYARRVIVPNHGLPTNYVYNSLNQIVKQTTPDAGTSQFWYDRLGRLTISQNAEQNSPTVAGDPVNRYSYTLYDPLGRVGEVGEKINIPSGSPVMSEDLARTPASLSGWLTLGNNRQVTVTAYDSKPSWAPTGILQTNLRKRVAATALLSLVSNPASPTDPSQNRQVASYYSYDLIGKVSTLVQENMLLINNEKQLVHGTDGLTGYKTIQYDYDLISGKVYKVMYQPGKWDQFNFQYVYDGDNRLLKAFTRREDANGDPLTSNNWTQEANYTYYPHGLLARTELGSQVQGLDYAYTLQGWLKGVNGNFLDASADMSKDGLAPGATPFGDYARDAIAYSLGYYSGDYTPIGANLSSNPANAFELHYQAPNINKAAPSGKDLFNANISNTTYSIAKLESGNPVGYSYRYDQLNRMKVMDRHNLTAGSTSWNNTSIIADYAEQVAYDANGNILTYERNGISGTLPNGAGGGLPMDILTYGYNLDAEGHLVNNKLRHVKDAVAAGAYTQDIDDQADDNYIYDKIGNQTGDLSENGMQIKWNAYGKIESISKPGVSSIVYSYDVAGHRINKTVTQLDVSPTATTTTHYVRDGSGNIMAIYSYKFTGSSTTPTEGNWLEQDIYSLNRLGTINPNVRITSGAPLGNDNYASNSSIGPLQGVFGLRTYELTNHLGNVLSVVGDLKLAVGRSDGQGIDHYEANVISAQDYYPYGMIMPGRQWSVGSAYRYGFNGQERSTEINDNLYNAEYWEFDSRIGRRWNLDPNPTTGVSDYATLSGNPIIHVDILGDSAAPKSTKEQAIALVNQQIFKKSPFFKNITPEEFKTQLLNRLARPEEINQGNTDFCWAASLSSYVFEKNPLGMAKAMISLYNTGVFSYANGTGSFNVTPSGAVRDAIGSTNLTDDSKITNKVDQMLLMSLANTCKGYMNMDRHYDRKNENAPSWAGGNLAKVKSVWNSFGYDVKVTGSDLSNGDIGTQMVMNALEKDDVVLFINGPTFRNNQWWKNWSGTHFIRVDGLSRRNEQTLMHYWDYGAWKDAKPFSEGSFNFFTYGVIQIPR